MQNRTDYAGLPIRDRFRQTAGQYRRALEMAAAAAGGAVFAGAHILGGIAPFGVALAAAVPEGLFLPALFGALFGYLWFPAPGSAMEYAAAILLLLALCIVPFLKIFLYGTILKLCAGLLGLSADKRLTGCIDRAGDAVFVLLRIAFTALACFLILFAIITCLAGTLR